MNDQFAGTQTAEEIRHEDRKTRIAEKRALETARRRRAAWASVIAAGLAALISVKAHVPTIAFWLDWPLIAVLLAVALAGGARALDGPEPARSERPGRLATRGRVSRRSPSGMLSVWLSCFLAIAGSLLIAKLINDLGPVNRRAAADAQAKEQRKPSQIEGTLTLTIAGRERKYEVKGDETTKPLGDSGVP